MENTNRNAFGLHGIAGYLIAVVLLLSILAFLTIKAIGVQSATAMQYYEIKDKTNITMYSLDNEKHVVLHGASAGAHRYEQR